MESENVLAALAVALQAAIALRIVVVLCTWFAQQPFAGEKQKWVKEQLHKIYHLMFSGKLGEGREFQEMDRQRCRIFLWWCECLQLFVLARLYHFSFQLGNYNQHRASRGLTCRKLLTPDTMDIVSTLGLLAPFFPLTSGQQDFTEIVFVSSASFVPRFFLALFMKRLWIAVVLNVAYGACCVWQTRQASDPTSDDLGVKGILAAQTVALIFSACMNKWFMYEYVDGDMKMLMDSPQLAGMLLRGTPAVAQGSNFAELFCPADKPRVEQYFSNARMLDGDSNEVNVELLQAQFHNASGEQCFLVGVREFQDTNAITAMYHPPGHIAESDAEPAPIFHLPDAVIFDACSFKILFASAAFQSLSNLLGRGRETPCYLQELSQEQGASSLIGQAQHAVNSENQDGQTLSGPLLLYDRLQVSASIQFEHDGELDVSVGVMPAMKTSTKTPAHSLTAFVASGGCAGIPTTSSTSVHPKSSYRALVLQKFAAVLAAAGSALGPDGALVIPDVGCGAYGNDPGEVGTLLGEALKRQPGLFSEIHLVGQGSFADAVVNVSNGLC
eukprot:s1300_g4.t1